MPQPDVLMPTKIKEFSPSFFHGTKAQLHVDDLLVARYNSNYIEQTPSKFVYFTSNLEVAVWGAELAAGDGACRIYVVEPLGAFEDDPNVTDKKFPGNPTKSYRTLEPLQILAEVTDWRGHTAEAIQARRQAIAAIMQSGGKIIED